MILERKKTLKKDTEVEESHEDIYESPPESITAPETEIAVEPLPVSEQLQEITEE